MTAFAPAFPRMTRHGSRALTAAQARLLLGGARRVRRRVGAGPLRGRRLLGHMRAPAAPGHGMLTERELEVLRLVAAGTANREVARRLFISGATVKTHLLHPYAKLDVRDRAAAVAAGYETGLLG